jgi:serine/threonine-protein phosphatase 2A regulatory subunit B
MGYPISRHPEFRYKTEFQSHEPEVLFSVFYSWLDFRCIFSDHASNIHCCVFNFFCGQFDYLKSLEIEEKINKIRWCQTANGALFLLSTNDKTIKYWKVGKEPYLEA